MRILIIEDNKRLAENIKTYIELEHYTVDVAHEGDKGLRCVFQNNYDLIVLDINLPGMDGYTLCKKIREAGKKVPIIMLTSRAALEDKIHGLELGGDDYLTKPFELQELLTRIKVQFRRDSQNTSELVTLGDLQIDFTHKLVTKDAKSVPLSPKEFAIFEYLIRNKGNFKNRTDILTHVWGEESDDLELNSDTVEVHIAYLRKKLGKECIKTKKGYGYYVE